MKKKSKSLGTNLTSLLSSTISSKPFAVQSIATKKNNDLININPETIIPNPFQPRTEFDAEQIENLAMSIKSQGMIQPIAVRIKGNSYELIAGERRLRAAQFLKLKTIPAFIRNCSDHDSLAMALIENIQREGLSSIEESKALKQLQSDFNLKHEEIAALVGKSRTTISNSLRLLNLHPDVQSMLHEKKIDAGHARALLQFSKQKQKQFAKTIAEKGLSVRQVEAMNNKIEKKTVQKDKLDKNIIHLEQIMQEHFLTNIKIKHSEKTKKGQILINYDTLEHLDSILEKMSIHDVE